MNFVASLNLSVPSLRTSFSPFFRQFAASAVLAALLVKFSTIVAPAFKVEVSAWALTFLYLYFALARVAFVRAHAAFSGNHPDTTALVRGQIAFSLAFRGRYRSVLFIAGLILTATSLADVMLVTVDERIRSNVAGLILTCAGAAWLALAPAYLLAISRWAATGDLAMADALGAVRRAAAFIRVPWLTAVMMIGAGTLVVMGLIYDPLRALVVAVLPSGTAVFLFSAVMYACAILFQMWVQANFSGWLITTNMVAEPAAAVAAKKEEVSSRPAQKHFVVPVGAVICDSYRNGLRVVLAMSSLVLVFGLLDFANSLTKLLTLSALELTSPAARFPARLIGVPFAILSCFLAAPLAIAVHRFVVLGEYQSRYIFDLKSRRFRRFVAASVVLSGLDEIASLLILAAPLNAKFAIAFTSYAVAIGLITWLPAIAVDRLDASALFAWATLARNKFRALVCVLAAALPSMALALVPILQPGLNLALQGEASSARISWLALNTAVGAISNLVMLATATRLYLTFREQTRALDLKSS